MKSIWEVSDYHGNYVGKNRNNQSVIRKIETTFWNLLRFGLLHEVYRFRTKFEADKISREQMLVYSLKREKDYFTKRPRNIERAIIDQYYSIMHRETDLNNPDTFTDYIQQYKATSWNNEMAALVDKIKVKNWVADLIGDEKVIPTYGVWSTYEQIDWGSFPKVFVLKCNYGSGMNIIIQDKDKIDKEEIKTIVDLWLKKEYAWLAMELQYDKVEKKSLLRNTF